MKHARLIKPLGKGVPGYTYIAECIWERLKGFHAKRRCFDAVFNGETVLRLVRRDI